MENSANEVPTIEPHRSPEPSAPPQYSEPRYHMYGTIPGMYYNADAIDYKTTSSLPYISLFFCFGFLFPFFWLLAAFWINSPDINERMWARVSLIGFITYMLLGSIVVGATVLSRS